MAEFLLSDPTPKDMERALFWAHARDTRADIWTRLSPEQQAMVEQRIQWALDVDLSEWDSTRSDRSTDDG